MPSMVSYSDRDYELVREDIKKPREQSYWGFFACRQATNRYLSGSGGLEHVENLFHLHDHLLDELMILGGLLRVGTAG